MGGWGDYFVREVKLKSSIAPSLFSQQQLNGEFSHFCVERIKLLWAN
jgi:hypothetical protein